MSLLYEDLSYQIIGSVQQVHNRLGYGYQEKEYQKALEEEFNIRGIHYKRELYSVLMYNDKPIRKYFVDFLVEDRIILELKVAKQVYQRHIFQVLQYLQNHNLKLGLICVLTPDSVMIKRIIN